MGMTPNELPISLEKMKNIKIKFKLLKFSNKAKFYRLFIK